MFVECFCSAVNLVCDLVRNDTIFNELFEVRSIIVVRVDSTNWAMKINRIENQLVLVAVDFRATKVTH